MSWFQRRVGPRPPSRIGLIWRAMVIGPAPVRLWAQVLGFGTVVGVIVHTLHLFFKTINAAGTSEEIRTILANGAVLIALSLCFIALVEVIAITELKVGLNASRDGLHADMSRDGDDEPKKVDVSLTGTATLTPEPPK